MYCQACGAYNEEQEGFCSRCHQKLLVLSGANAEQTRDFEADEDETFSFDEHLLERISILEEAVKRTAESIRAAMVALNKQERSILVNQTGLATLRELLEGKRLLARDEWSDRWTAQMDYQLLALEKRQRFLDLKERIGALYAGKKRKLFERLLGDAEYAFFAFDVERAMSALETAFKLHRDNYELAYFLGETHFNDGETEQALPYFSRVLEVEPEHFEGLVFAAAIHHERGDTPRAERLLKRALTLKPDSFLPNFSLGAVHASRGEVRRAAAYLEKAIEMERVAEALFLLGSCYYEMGKSGRAARRLEEVVGQDPAHEEAYHLLGLAYLDRGWNRKALQAFKQAQRLNPKRLRYQDLVRYLSGQGSSPLPAVDDEARHWLDRAESSIGREKPDRTLSYYRRALGADPDNPTLLISFALACLELNRSRETEVLTRRLLDLEPDEMLRATACATLIEALRSEGRFREGNRVGYRLLKESTSAFGRTIAYYEMAFNLAEMEEDLDRALEFARESLAASPEELKQFPLAAMGWVLYKRREFERAVDYLRRSSDLDPSTETLTHLGMALLAGEDRQARVTLAQARDLEGRRGTVQQRMMECMQDSSRLLERVREREKK
jgi:tetratricopeptide (TPR) repeat protein